MYPVPYTDLAITHDWVPVADHALQQRSRQKIDEIAAYLIGNPDFIKEYNLLCGKTGVALFFYYYYMLTGEESYYAKMQELLNETIESINHSTSPYFPHCGGISGVAWTLDFLQEQGVLDDGAYDIFGSNLYETLHKEALFFLSAGNYDYLHGAAGILLYLKEKSVDISTAVQRLLDMAMPDGDNLKWPSCVTDVLDRPDLLSFNMSLAHGNPGILFILSRIHQFQPELVSEATIRKLLSFVLSTENTGESSLSLYPNFICSPSVDFGRDSRLAWCYGDLGLAFILLQCADILHDHVIAAKACSIFDRCANRIDFKDNRVVDATFCHGTSGIAHVFNRAFQRTGDKEYKSKAVFWYNATLEQAVYPQGAAGYTTWQQQGRIRLPGLIDGIAGIGIALISAISDITPKWDRFFLLS